MATKQDKINAVLNELKMATSDIQGLAVISPDGMMIADQLGGGAGRCGSGDGGCAG